MATVAAGAIAGFGPLAGCAVAQAQAQAQAQVQTSGAAAPHRWPAEADGFAALDGGTAALDGVAAARRFDIRSRAELDAALRLGDQPKLLRIHGRIDLAVGRGAAAFADPAFDFDAYCRAYAPEAWGRRPPTGALEEARQRSARRQAEAVVVPLPPHTTLVGATPDAGFADGTLMLDGAHHVVLRGLHFHGVQDHFPAWDPLDGARGEWNSDYDAVALRRSHHVWVDHCHFESAWPARQQVFERLLQSNDGLLDITRASDLVTVSWCRFAGHDKTMLIGGSDNHRDDDGRLRVSLHHNLWLRCAERTPRVRYGRVHLANNLFVLPAAGAYGYSIGLGHRARIACEANVWESGAGVADARLVRVLARSLEDVQFSDSGSLHNGRAIRLGDVLRGAHPPPAAAAHPPAAAAAHPPPPAAVAPADFAPPPVRGLVAASEVAGLVRAGAGAHASS
ncbi:MAG: polysaccharide lyase family 1 protein [Burkholderiales bacterium]|nr:polysaccharide lyase family 1 protein [Burkholderiales bacterium]